MTRKIIIILTSFFFFYSILYAEEKRGSEEKDEVKEKIVIFYFQDNSKSEMYSYYSFIVPNSISLIIQETGRYEVETYTDVMNSIGKSFSEEFQNEQKDELLNKGKETGANYIITGSYFVIDSNLSVKSQLFDMASGEVVDIEESSDRIGAILLKIIDQLSDNIHIELDISHKKKIQMELEEEEKRRKAALSPFLSLYNFFSGFTFGINYGKVQIYEEYKDVYEETDSVSVYLYYELANIDFFKKTVFFNNLAFSANSDYFSTNTKDYDEDRSGSYNYERSYLSVWGASFNISYLLRFSSYFNAALSAGGGTAFSKFELEPHYYEVEEGSDDYITPEEFDRKSFDPFLELYLSC